MPDPSTTPGAVFLSYASQDAEAAQRICTALRAAGLEVWFDQSELRGGDAWDAKIRSQIAQCALFVPLISATTQGRREAYFRLEWKLAEERTHLMAEGTPFLLPVTIDATTERGALVPKSFLAVQWTKLPGGETPPAFAERIRRLLEGEAPPAAAASAPGPARAPAKPAWLRYGWMAVGLVFALVYAVRPLFQSTRRAEPRPAETPPAAAPAAASQTEARRLAQRARAVFDATSQVRADLESAEQLYQKAVALDPTDADVWGVGAEIDAGFYLFGYDVTEVRAGQAQLKAARALKLDPESVEARFAQAMVLAYVVAKPDVLPEAERLVDQVLQVRPDDRRVILVKGAIMEDLGRTDEAAQCYRRVNDPWAEGYAYLFAGRYDEADAVAERGLQAGYAARDTESGAGNIRQGLLLKLWTNLRGREDLDAAQAAMDRLPPAELLEDEAVCWAFELRMLRREPDKAIEVMQKFPRDWLTPRVDQDGPLKAYNLGRAHLLAGRPEAAEVEWRSALRQVEERLATQANDPGIQNWRALLQARLGQPAEAERSLRLAEQLEKLPRGKVTRYNLETNLLLGRREAVLEALPGIIRSERIGTALHILLRYDPLYDPLRPDPRFAALLQDTSIWPSRRTQHGIASFAAPPVAAAPAADDKSVAVLAFANLSDDRSNEYFSDGVSEELLNVLAKVPGLKVTARTSSFHFKGKDTPIPEIASQLGVAYVVEGSVRKAGDKVRITAQLIKAADGFHVWSDTFTRDLKDIFAVQDEIAGLIAQNLQLRMGIAVPAARRAVNPEAHQLVLEGRYFWNLRTTEGFDRAEAAFTKATELDPQFAQAYAGLADVGWVRTVYASYAGRNYVPGNSGEAAQRAIELDPLLAEAYPAAAAALQWAGRLPEAEVVFKKAIILNPNYALGHHWHALMLEGQGRLDDALAEIEQAIQLDPLSATAHATRARFLFMAGRVAEALAADDKALSLRPGFFFSTGIRAQALLSAGRREEALSLARAIVSQAGLELRYVADAAAISVLRTLGHEAEAVAHAEKLLLCLPADSFMRGLVLAALDRWDEATPYLERTPRGMCEIFYWNPLWDRWRDDPRFGRLLTKLNCGEEYKVARATLARMQQTQETK
jgi:TolB-like protein